MILNSPFDKNFPVEKQKTHSQSGCFSLDTSQRLFLTSQEAEAGSVSGKEIVGKVLRITKCVSL